jgi:hypothetical protein
MSGLSSSSFRCTLASLFSFMKPGKVELGIWKSILCDVLLFQFAPVGAVMFVLKAYVGCSVANMQFYGDHLLLCQL